jgi:hypothetical protein
MAGGRIVISKAGFDASNPLLSDLNKIFDSNWDFSNLYLEGGPATDPLWTGGGGASPNTPFNIMFKRTYNFVPAAIVWGYYPVTSGLLLTPIGTPQQELPGFGPNAMIYNDRIVIDRLLENPGGSVPNYYRAATMQYALFSVL